MNDDRSHHPTICVDLNGVLDIYTGWKHEKHWDPPRPGAGEFLRDLNERGFRVVVFTTRWATMPAPGSPSTGSTAGSPK